MSILEVNTRASEICDPELDAFGAGHGAWYIMTNSSTRITSPIGCPGGEAPRRSGLVGSAVLLAGVLAGTGMSVPASAAALTPVEPSAAPLVPGTIFVANARAAFLGAQGTGEGSVTAYGQTATGNIRPILVITKGIMGPSGLTFDSSGDLWVANNSNDNNVVEYSKAELSSPSPAPTVTISQSGSGAMGLAFDPSGDLWVTKDNFTAVEFTRAQLAKSGSPVPQVTITNINQCSVVFDPSGDLWEGSFGDVVTDFTRAQLARSGSPTPQVTVTSGSLNMPCRPTFDAVGNMWAANYMADTLVEFTKSQLVKSGSPTPPVIVSSDYLANPGDVSFDAAGDLWVPSAQDEAVVEFTRPQLAKSGAPTPARTVFGPATGLSWPWAVAVEP
jgi:hypothetical protein